MRNKNIVVCLPKLSGIRTETKCRLSVPELIGSDPEEISLADAVRMQLLTEAGTALLQSYLNLPAEELQGLLSSYQVANLPKLVTLTLVSQQSYLLSIYYAKDILLAAEGICQSNTALSNPLQYAAESRPLSE